MKTITFLLFFLFPVIFDKTCTKSGNHFPYEEISVFRLGCEVLLENPEPLKNKNIGVITNQTGITSDGRHIVDEMVSKGLKVVRIFSPEHGIRGDEHYPDRDPITGIQVVSLYGAKIKPSADDLRGIDVLVYDIQDVGARFYTYTSTLRYCMEAAVESKVKFIVCDRPIVINPNYVDGFMLDDKYSSFVGSVPVPVCYGMTAGELSLYLNNRLLNSQLELTVIEMKGYTRESDYLSLNLKWIKPSPSMFFPSTALCYAATCFLEGTNVSEGRGTEKPFEYAGAPWIDGEKLAEKMNSYGLSGVEFQAVSFIPSEKISAYPPKFLGKKCNGIFINVTDKLKFEPVKCGVVLIHTLFNLFSQFEFTQKNFIDKLAGTDRLRRAVIDGKSVTEIFSMWDTELRNFKSEREGFLIYK
ncbi:MAG: DUF1343 domain-containing protein [Ignavibacteria bacterium]|nr:DUF1343 domain-containing protein [Ignavibacteria bacterium]